MKNKLFIIISIALATIFIAGCFTQNNAAISVGKAIKSSLNQLSSTVSKLDTIDNSYIRETDNKSNNILSQPTRNADPKATTIAEDNTLNKLLEEEIIERLICDEDGNCNICNEKYICNDDNLCNNCNSTINFDKYGNCVYCKNQLKLNGDNCNTCNKKVVTTKSNSNLTSNIIDRLTTISNNNKNINSNTINNVSSNTLDENNTLDDTIVDNNNLDLINNSTDNTSNNQTNESTNTNKNYEFIIYTEETFIPEQIKYNPRYVNNYDVQNANEHINRYIGKLQKFYAISTDVLEANNTLSNYKLSVLSNIDETNTLNNNIINGTYTPNEQQIIALNNYISDIKNTINNLKNCNGKLVKEINSIPNTNSLTTSIEVINSNYVKLLNHIDTRISYHENALATLEQIKYLISDMSNNNNNPSIDNNTDNIVNDNVVIDNDTSDNVVTNNTDIDNSEIYNQNENILDNNTTNIDTITDENIINNSSTETNVNDIIDDSNLSINSDVENTTQNIINDEYIQDENLIESNQNNNTTDNDINLNNNTNINEENTDRNIIENVPQINNENNVLIDTYDNHILGTNIDTFRNNNLIENVDTPSPINAEKNIVSNSNTKYNNDYINNVILDENNLNKNSNTFGY